MQKITRLLLTILIGLLPLISKSQASISDSSFTRSPVWIKRELRVGVPGDYAPFAMAKGDSLYGSDISMLRALAEAMQVRMILIKTSWPNLMRDMKDNKFDLAIGGISITPERLAIAPFSIPYHSGGKTFICLRKDSLRFLTPADANRTGVRLIVNKGGTNESVARAQFTLATLRVYPNNIGVFDEILAGRADVMLTDDTEADLKVRKIPQLCRSFKGIIANYDKAIWIQNDKVLLNFINSWLQKAIKAGQVDGWLNMATRSNR